MTEQQLKTIIRTEMKEQGINATSLAEMTDMNKSILSKWFNDRQSLKVSYLLRIVDALGIAVRCSKSVDV